MKRKRRSTVRVEPAASDVIVREEEEDPDIRTVREMTNVIASISYPSMKAKR